MITKPTDIDLTKAETIQLQVLMVSYISHLYLYENRVAAKQSSDW
jgi:hypothetical protein